MGNCCGKAVPELKVTVFGLDGSGKSTHLRVLEASAFARTSSDCIESINVVAILYSLGKWHCWVLKVQRTAPVV
jgi:GTPase SAR1 family protein